MNHGKVWMPPSSAAHHCVVAGIDSGKDAGFGIVSPWSNRCFTAVDAEQRAWCLQQAFALALEHQVPLVIVAEKWRQQGRWGFAAAGGLSAQWGKWLSGIEAFKPYKIGRSVWPKIVRVYPDQWRAAVLGNRNLRKDAAKALAVRRAEAVLGTAVPDHNAAEAFCIALWGEHAGEVAKLMPKGRRT